MKLTDMIESLQYMFDTYGDLEIEILTYVGKSLIEVEPDYINYTQYDDGDKCSIQDFPY